MRNKYIWMKLLYTYVNFEKNKPTIFLGVILGILVISQIVYKIFQWKQLMAPKINLWAVAYLPLQYYQMRFLGELTLKFDNLS